MYYLQSFGFSGNDSNIWLQPATFFVTETRHTKKARYQYQILDERTQRNLGLSTETKEDYVTTVPLTESIVLPTAAAASAVVARKPEDAADTASSRLSSAASLKDDESGEEGKMDDKLTFPERLMYLLQNETEPDALWWQKDGLSFGFEPKIFTERVLNKLFPSKIKFESFIRKLNRWGFRRVPGQGLPPNGAAYKHPFFKKDDPELMKSMKFGQKGEPTPKSSPFLDLDPTRTAALGRVPQLPTGFEHTLALQSLTANQSQTLQSLQQQAFLQSMATSHQRQAAVAAEYLAQQQFATDALATSTDSEAELRNRLLLGSTAGSLSNYPLQPTMHPFLQRNTSQASQQGGQLSGAASAYSSALSDMELRNRLLLGHSADSLQHQHQRHQNSAQSDRFGAFNATGLTMNRTGGSSLGTIPSASPQADLSSRLLLSGLSNNTQSQHSQDQGILDQLAFLRQQQAMRSPTADILFLLEQERKRNQGNQDK